MKEFVSQLKIHLLEARGVVVAVGLGEVCLQSHESPIMTLPLLLMVALQLHKLIDREVLPSVLIDLCVVRGTQQDEVLVAVDVFVLRIMSGASGLLSTNVRLLAQNDWVAHALTVR